MPIQITQKIAEKEKKGRTYQSNAKLDSLTNEKRAKIKDYVKSYVGKLRLHGTSASASKDPRKQRTENAINGEVDIASNEVSGPLEEMQEFEENGKDSLSQSEDAMSEDSDDDSDENDSTVKMEVDP